MNTYKYFDMEVSSWTNIVKQEYVKVHYWEVDLSRPLYACIMFDENSFIDAACMLKLQVINPSYLIKLCEW